MTLPPDWRVVNSLYTLRDQINARWPNRSKISDGFVADPKHGVTSDHYPHDVAALGSRPVVTAIDVTHDPAHGVDTYALADILRQSRDSRIKYIISNRRIASNHPVSISGRRYEAFEWRLYTEPDPHQNHMHLSVVDAAVADSGAPWLISRTRRMTMFMIRATDNPDVFLSNGSGHTRAISPALFARLTNGGMPYFEVDRADFDLVANGLPVQVGQTQIEDAVDGVMSRVGFTVRPRI